MEWPLSYWVYIGKSPNISPRMYYFVAASLGNRLAESFRITSETSVNI
jgi:hypothetical protein